MTSPGTDSASSIGLLEAARGGLVLTADIRASKGAPAGTGSLSSVDRLIPRRGDVLAYSGRLWLRAVIQAEDSCAAGPSCALTDALLVLDEGSGELLKSIPLGSSSGSGLGSLVVAGGAVWGIGQWQVGGSVLERRIFGVDGTSLDWVREPVAPRLTAGTSKSDPTRIEAIQAVADSVYVVTVRRVAAGAVQEIHSVDRVSGELTRITELAATRPGAPYDAFSVQADFATDSTMIFQLVSRRVVFDTRSSTVTSAASSENAYAALPDGRLVFRTATGLEVKDGDTTTSTYRVSFGSAEYGEQDNDIVSVAARGDVLLTAARDGGFALIDMATGQVLPFAYLSQGGTDQIRYSDPVAVIAGDAMWLVTKNRLFRLQPASTFTGTPLGRATVRNS